MKIEVEKFLALFDGAQISDVGEGMLLVREVIARRWRNRFLVNTEEHEAYELVGGDLQLKCLCSDDIEWESLESYKHQNTARQLRAPYPFSVYAFNDGVAYVDWTLYPDGMYFMDEDGFGMDDGKEECLGAYIDRNGRFLVPFRPMNDARTREKYRKKALRALLRMGARN